MLAARASAQSTSSLLAARQDRPHPVPWSSKDLRPAWVRRSGPNLGPKVSISLGPKFSISLGPKNWAQRTGPKELGPKIWAQRSGPKDLGKDQVDSWRARREGPRHARRPLPTAAPGLARVVKCRRPPARPQRWRWRPSGRVRYRSGRAWRFPPRVADLGATC